MINGPFTTTEIIEKQKYDMMICSRTDDSSSVDWL